MTTSDALARLVRGQHGAFAIFGRLRETRVLPPHHLVVVDGITCTNVCRTIFDLAAVL